ncbi:hypothetical protein SESBI_14286 [Sesbania bispinosa]|nr:hypothetical protein SESBI_14286 [Sesbania bispinosa]
MHPRQRSPRGFYASEYRHRGGDGLLPPNVLSLKWHNHNGGGGFKKHVGEIPVEGGRTSALARLGNAAGAAGDGGPSGRRKLGFEEFGQKGRRRGSFRSNGLDWGREYRRNGSWSDRFRGATDIKEDDDGGGSSSVRHQDEEQHQHQHQHQQVCGGDEGDNVLQKSSSNEFLPRREDGDDLDAETDKDQVSGELLDLKQSSSSAGKDTCDMDVEFVKSSNDLENVNAGVNDVKDGSRDDDNDKPSNSKNLSAQSSDQENTSSGKVFTDLLSLCKSVKVPTKTRSSLTHKGLKAHPHRNNGDENTHDVGDLQGPEVLAENESVKGSSSGDLLSEKTYDLVHLGPDISEVEPVKTAENMKELDTACKVEEVPSIGSQSDQDRGYVHDTNQESTTTLPEYGSCSSMAEERGEKRVAEDDVVREETKRLREWLPSPVPKTEEYFLHNNPIEVKESPGEDEISHIDKVTMTSDHGSLISSSQFTEGGDRPFFQCSEEKPSLPSSFRTCDLNLIEASEVHENHVDHPVLIYPPPVSETKKAVPVDIDLSMSHASVAAKFSTHATSGKEIEVIDLENDSIQEVKSIDNMDRKTETMFPGLEGFSNHAQNAADIHDVQDGYGLMISELLGTDFTNCSSVPGDINSVHNEMGLHNGTVPGTLAEDDSIYMSLGELMVLFGCVPLQSHILNMFWCGLLHFTCLRSLCPLINPTIQLLLLDQPVHPTLLPSIMPCTATTCQHCHPKLALVCDTIFCHNHNPSRSDQ